LKDKTEVIKHSAAIQIQNHTTLERDTGLQVTEVLRVLRYRRF